MTAQLPNPDTLERIVHAALAAGDIKAVEAALYAMAPQDPHRAEQLMDAMRMGLILRDAAERQELTNAKDER